MIKKIKSHRSKSKSNRKLKRKSKINKLSHKNKRKSHKKLKFGLNPGVLDNLLS